MPKKYLHPRECRERLVMAKGLAAPILKANMKISYGLALDLCASQNILVIDIVSSVAGTTSKISVVLLYPSASMACSCGQVARKSLYVTKCTMQFGTHNPSEFLVTTSLVLLET